MSLVLLTCAGALLESLWNRESISLGVRTDGVVTAQLAPGARYAQPARRADFYERLEMRLARMPGVQSAALSDSLPPGGVPRSQPIFAPAVEGKPPFDETTPGIVVWRTVTPGYFRTMGIRILRGRGFTEEDRRPNARAIVISDSYARRLFGGDEPIGRRMCRFPSAARDQAIWYTIVGVASDARNGGLTDGSDPEYYLVRRHGGTAWEDAPHVTAAIVRGGSAKALAALLRTEIAALDPALPPPEIRTLESHVGRLAARPRFQAWLLALFAGIGALLAALGLYGLVAFLVVEREREFGIRLALGATPGAVIRMLLGDGLRWTAAGMVLGLATAGAASLLLRSVLFHVSPADPAAYLAAAAVLVMLALGAALLPARRVARVDPANALRQD